MNPDYLGRLSPKVQALVLEVERAAGIDIAVNVDSSRDGRGPDGAGILACDINENGATILVPNDTYFPDGSVVHEVLHIRRILVDKVPRLATNTGFAGWTPQLENGLATLDNDLEHWVIVPDEIRQCPERDGHWQHVLERTWSNDIPNMTNKDDQLRYALIHWASLMFFLPQSAVVSIASDALRQLELEMQADRIVEAARAHLGNKEKLVPIMLEHLRIPLEAVVLEYIDITLQESHEVALQK